MQTIAVTVSRVPRKNIHWIYIPSRPFAKPDRVKITGRTGYGGCRQMTM
jgi:hypothetical protein